MIKVNRIVIVYDAYGPATIMLYSQMSEPCYPYGNEVMFKIHAVNERAEQWVENSFPCIPYKTVGSF